MTWFLYIWGAISAGFVLFFMGVAFISYQMQEIQKQAENPFAEEVIHEPKPKENPAPASRAVPVSV